MTCFGHVRAKKDAQVNVMVIVKFVWMTFIFTGTEEENIMIVKDYFIIKCVDIHISIVRK